MDGEHQLVMIVLYGMANESRANQSAGYGREQVTLSCEAKYGFINEPTVYEEPDPGLTFSMNS